VEYTLCQTGLTILYKRVLLAVASLTLFRSCGCRGNSSPGFVKPPRRSGNFVKDSGYSLSRMRPDRANPLHRVAHCPSSVFDRATLWNGWWRDRAREPLLPPWRSCRGLLAIGDSGRSWIPPGNSMCRLYPAGGPVPAELSLFDQPLSRKRAGRSSNACGVPVCRLHGPGSMIGFPPGFFVAGSWRRKWAEVWACFFARTGPNGNPYGPTYVCASRHRLEARVNPDG
jgi:hypothetical protein